MFVVNYMHVLCHDLSSWKSEIWKYGHVSCSGNVLGIFIVPCYKISLKFLFQVPLSLLKHGC